MSDVSAKSLGCFDPYRPKLQFGFGSGPYSNSEISKWETDGLALTFTSDYNLNRKWELSLQQQIGTWRISDYEGNFTDIDFSIYAMRSFFRFDNLKFGMGLGYGRREWVKTEKSKVYGSPSVHVKKSGSCLTVPVKVDLRICHFRSLSFNMRVGMVLFNESEHGFFNYYIMPVLKVSL